MKFPIIIVNKEVCYAFDYTFGMDRADAQYVQRYLSPQFVSVLVDKNPVSLLEFSDGKLIRLYCQGLDANPKYGVWVDCRPPPELLDKEWPQSWDNGKLKFTATIFDADKEIFGNDGGRAYPCLVIEKK